MNLNMKQILAIAGAILGVLVTSTAGLTEVFGAGPAKVISAIAGMGVSVINSVVAVLSGQANTVKEVAAMPGVESITVNPQANQTLAAVAIDPKQDKVAPVEGKEAIVKDIAES